MDPKVKHSRSYYEESALKVTQNEATPASARTSITATSRARETTTLKWTVYPILCVAFYTTFALLAWIFVCIMSKRPIRIEKSYYEPIYSDPEETWRINEKYIKAAEVLRAIVALLTIPVTSAVCSVAFVAYMQAGPLRRTLNLRQTMAIADQGWISPRIWTKLVKAGSFPLYLAFALTLIGSISQILQNAFVDKENIKAGNRHTEYIVIKDIPDMFDVKRSRRNYGEQIYQLRSLVDSATQDDYEANLWNEYVRPECRSLKVFDSKSLCTYRGRTKDTFFSELPSNFSTGVLDGYYAPRISSDTSYENITEADFTDGCRNETDNGGFYAAYGQTYVGEDEYWFGVTACMPGDLRVSPWKPTRDRQDIKEELYLNYTYQSGGSHFYRVTAKTALGYFELPNYKNGNRPGPLLDEDPLKDDARQAGFKKNKREISNITSSGNETLLTLNHPGPLTALALAMFGKGSFIETRLSNPSAYRTPPAIENVNDNIMSSALCIGLAPFAFLLNGGSTCIHKSDTLDKEGALRPVYNWLLSLNPRIDVKDDARASMFTAGVFLANKVWLGPASTASSYPSLPVEYDLGIDTIKPKISTPKMIVGSVFLGLHLLGLWLLAMYALIMRPWISDLGAEAMLIMGTSYAERLGRVEGREWKRALNELPGYIGDVRPKEEVGRMMMGAATPLRMTRKYDVLR